MTMTDPQALINNLSAALQANDIASGKVALTQLKVCPSTNSQHIKIYIIDIHHFPLRLLAIYLFHCI